MAKTASTKIEKVAKAKEVKATPAKTEKPVVQLPTPTPTETKTPSVVEPVLATPTVTDTPSAPVIQLPTPTPTETSTPTPAVPDDTPTPTPTPSPDAKTSKKKARHVGIVNLAVARGDIAQNQFVVGLEEELPVDTIVKTEDDKFELKVVFNQEYGIGGEGNYVHMLELADPEIGNRTGNEVFENTKSFLIVSEK